jgi:hypothetical protein
MTTRPIGLRAVFFSSWRFYGPFGASGGWFSSLQTQLYPSTASRLRCMYRFARAKFAHRRLWFFAMPLYLTLSKPKTRFTIRKSHRHLIDIARPEVAIYKLFAISMLRGPVSDKPRSFPRSSNDSRGYPYARGALNSEGSNNQDPRPLCQILGSAESPHHQFVVGLGDLGGSVCCEGVAGSTPTLSQIRTALAFVPRFAV